MNQFNESIKADLHRISSDVDNFKKDFYWIFGKNFPTIGDLRLLVTHSERITSKLNESIEREKMRNDKNTEETNNKVVEDSSR